MQSERKLPDQYEFDTADLSMSAIDLKEVTPSILTAPFLDIWHMTKTARQLYGQTSAEPKRITRDRAQRAIGNIDACLLATHRVEFSCKTDWSTADPSIEDGSAYPGGHLWKLWDAAASMFGGGWETRCIQALQHPLLDAYCVIHKPLGRVYIGSNRRPV